MVERKFLPLALVLAGLSSSAIAVEYTSSGGSGEFDMVIADEQKLIQMLQKSGKISQTASITEAEVVLRSYLKIRQQVESIKASRLDENVSGEFTMNRQLKANSKKPRHVKSQKDKILGRGRGHRPANIELEEYNGETREGRVLAILMEFPDFPHNSILPEDSDMYYEDYNQNHYRQILFGDDGWVAPNGYHANSFRQNYQMQSGGSYTVSGDVAGWYMASQPAAFYGNNTDGDAKALVREALTAVAADTSVDLSQFDIEDRYDLDGDGDYWEADGVVDHVMLFHSSVGEEAGGGQMGEDAIWAHRSRLANVFPIPGSTSNEPNWGGEMAVYDYTIAPIDSAVGVISHEYGHDLGLPDEYDTEYSGRGEPVSEWSLMSGGSGAGKLGGTEPTGFSAWAKEQLQRSMGGNWLHSATIEFDDITESGVQGFLDQASSKGTNHDAIRVNLPSKESLVTTPVSGEYAYFGGAANDLTNQMSTPVDLTLASSAVAKFKAWYDIESDYDYAYLMVTTAAGNVYVGGNITTNDDPQGINKGNGITGKSNGWIDAEFDLSAFAGQAFNLVFAYESDGGVVNSGLYVDDFSIEADGVELLVANADEPSNEIFNFSGFVADSGINYTEHYYLLEWRQHHGVDGALAYVNGRGETLVYEPGMLIWYVDGKYDNNWVGIHPGDGFLGVVDADQRTLKWSSGKTASSHYQIHDAAFSIDRHEEMLLDLEEKYGISLRDNHIKGQHMFNDRKHYMDEDIPDAGRNVNHYGLKIRVINQSEDRSVGAIQIYR